MRSFLAAGAAAVALIAGSAQATTITYTIADLLPAGGYSFANSGQTYTGTGFVGMYDYNVFAHLFGIESNSSRTAAQVGLSALAGATINSASLSYYFLDGYGNSGAMQITGFNSTGALGYTYNMPTADYGSISVPIDSNDHGQHVTDVTSIVSSAVGAGEDWLGLHFQSDISYPWTYTYAGADRAQLRLTVDYADAVPEPAMLGLFGLGAIGLGLARRRKA